MNLKKGMEATAFINKSKELDDKDCVFHVDLKITGPLAKKLMALDFVAVDKTHDWLQEVLNLGVNYIVNKKMNEIRQDKEHDCSNCEEKECPLREFYEKKA